jgi:murein DD-endopeptidase MepM/ murein hydrolase activator NlpD
MSSAIASRDAGAKATDGGASRDEPFIIHKVEKGQTLWDIARAYNLRVVDILNRNSMSDADARRLKPGLSIKIPGATEPRPIEVAADRSTVEETAPKRTGGIYHTVKYRETIWDIAYLFSIPVATIMAANSLTKEDALSIRPGRQVFVPGVERDLGGKVKRKRTPRQTQKQRRFEIRANRLGLGSRRTASMLLTGNVEQRWVSAAGGKRGRMPGTLRWPVTNGWFVRGYGSGKDGYHLGVDIAGEMGWNVRSAASGIVGYSGDGMKGYGNVVMVVHAGGWITMYAHNSVNFVVAGQKVRRGEILAELGKSGISRGPHVHFEFIYDRKNCDPSVLFRPGVRHKDGHLTPIEYTTWKIPKKKPKWVKCSKHRFYPHDDTEFKKSADPEKE